MFRAIVRHLQWSQCGQFFEDLKQKFEVNDFNRHYNIDSSVKTTISSVQIIVTVVLGFIIFYSHGNEVLKCNITTQKSV